MSDGTSPQDKLDFWLYVGVSAFLSGTLLAGDSYTDLLSGGTLSHRSSILLRPVQPKQFSQASKIEDSKYKEESYWLYFGYIVHLFKKQNWNSLYIVESNQECSKINLINVEY